MSQQWGGGYGPPAPPTGGYGAYGGYGGYGPPPNSSVKNQAIAALIANIVAVVFCCGIVAIGGLICAAIALSKADYEPEAAKKLNLWAWILLGGTFVLDILYLVFTFIFPFLFIPFVGAAGTS